MMVESPEWMTRAACYGSDPGLFFPAVAAGPEVDAAKAVCADCSVRVDCLLYALNEGEEHGIWGGLDETERLQFRRGRARLAIS